MDKLLKRLLLPLQVVVVQMLDPLDFKLRQPKHCMYEEINVTIATFT